ncbi:MAG: hypothetical protein DWQ00_06565 [Candidatus Scalindua sp.]|nr:MAG: hypothetical protein DWQ00_06565 [Candidatus Scalindua sp.]
MDKKSIFSGDKGEIKKMSKVYSSQIGFRFSEPDFTRPLDLSQSQYPRLDSTKALVLFNRKIKISGKLLPRNSKNQFAMSIFGIFQKISMIPRC